MDPALHDLARWRSLLSAEREAIAKGLMYRLPAGFGFLGLEKFELANQSNEIGVFEFQSDRFMLIPGGTVMLGYDAASMFRPTKEQLKSFQEEADEYNFPSELDIYQWVNDYTTPIHTVTVQPLLVEAQAHKAGVVKLSSADLAEFTSRDLDGSGFITDGTRRIYWTNHDGQISAHELIEGTHAHFTNQLSQTGFTMATSDEWEYLCGCGARTLFRWGDNCPCDANPKDIVGWDVHRRPNAFGLRMPHDTYDREVVAEPGIVRGGDGGGLICGGADYFFSWLTLASAYFDKYDYEHKGRSPDQDISGCCVRRVYRLV